MKKVFVATLFTAILFTLTPVFANDISITINGKNITFPQQPKVIEGRTLVPMRQIFEELGMVIEWENTTKTITAKNDTNTITMQVNNKELIVNNEKIVLDVAPQIVNGATLVPVREISESLKIDVVWDKNTNSIVIGEGAKEISTTNSNNTQQVEETSELVKKANEYMAKTDILNNCKNSVALIQNPKSVADLKANLNAMTGYSLSTMKARSDYKLVSMEQVITLNGKSLANYHDFGNFKNRVVGAVKLNVYDPNSTITMTRFITEDNEVYSYAYDGKELRNPFLRNGYIDTTEEHEVGTITGLVLKDNVVIGKLDYCTSLTDYSISIELFDEYKGEEFDSIALNVYASNYLDGYFNDRNLGELKYVSTIIKLPKIEFVDYQI